MSAWPHPDATRDEIAAWRLEHTVTPTPIADPPHEVPATENGPSIVCNACGIVRVGMFTPLCKGCAASMGV